MIICVYCTLLPEGTMAIIGEREGLEIEYYQYPVVPGDDEWAKLGSIEKRLDACRIPKDILSRMTDEALLQAIYDFPFLCDMYVYTDKEYAVEMFEKNCDAYAELLARNNAKEVMMKEVKDREDNICKMRNISAEQEIENDVLSMLIVFQQDFTAELSNDEIYMISDFSKVIECEVNNDVMSTDYLVDAESTDIFTPNNTPVAYYVRECDHLSLSYHSKLDSDAVETYGVTLLSRGTCKYNCHSYAWYSQSTSNNRWINFPIAYMVDGSYTRVLSSIYSSSLGVYMGDKVFYGTNTNPTHSAVISSGISGAPLLTRTAKSKWGELGLFEHTVNNVPSGYDLNNVSVWHR